MEQYQYNFIYIRACLKNYYDNIYYTYIKNTYV